MLTCFGRVGITVIPFLQAVVLRLRRSAIPGRANGARGLTDDTMVYMFEMVGREHQKRSRKAIISSERAITPSIRHRRLPVLYSSETK